MSSPPLSPWILVAVAPSPLGWSFCEVAAAVASRWETSHERRFELEARATPSGDEVFTRDVPNASEEQVAALDEHGVVRVGTRVAPGDLLIGRTAPRRGPPPSPADQLLGAVFGERAGDLDRSLRVPHGVSGTVTEARQEASPDSARARAVVVVAWTRPLEVGDVLVARDGRRVMVAAIDDLDVDVRWGDEAGPRELAKTAVARDAMAARAIGPYSLVTQRPLAGAVSYGGQRISAPLLAALVRSGNPWAAWELVTLKSDCVRGRTWAYESLVKGNHPTPDAPDLEAYGPPEPSRGRVTAPQGVRVAERELAALGFEAALDGGPTRGTWLTTAAVRARSCGAVTKPNTLDEATLKPHPGGLFCARIFGPVRDFECSCGAHKGRSHRGKVCATCGVEVTWSAVRRERFGHLDLTVPVPHPWRLAELAARLGLTPAEVLQVARGEADLVQGRVVEPSAGLEATGGAALLRALDGDPAGLMLQALPVLPADLRPIVPLDGGRFATSDLNDLYGAVINRCNRLRKLLELDVPPALARVEYGLLVDAVDALFDNARQPEPVASQGRALRSLRDLVEGHLGPELLAKTVDYSGAAHLVADLSLADDRCRLPLSLALELFKPWAYGLMEARGYVSTIRAAKRAIEVREPWALAAIADVAAHWPVLLATERGVATRHVELWDAPAVAVDRATAATLASDTVVIYVPLTAPAVERARVSCAGVIPLRPVRPPSGGWLAELLGGGDLPTALGRAAAGEVDTVDDPLMRLALGCWPSAAAAPAPWLTDAIIGRTPP